MRGQVERPTVTSANVCCPRCGVRRFFRVIRYADRLVWNCSRGHGYETPLHSSPLLVERHVIARRGKWFFEQR